MVPATGTPQRRPASTSEVAPTPPIQAARAARSAAEVPWARRAPKSSTEASWAARAQRAALVASNVW